jgi:hypothetical protein
MKQRTAYGIASITFGVLALLLVSAALHAESFRGTGSAHLLMLADRWGLVRTPPADAELEIKPSTIMALTDETAITGVLIYGGYLAVVAMLVASWAGFKREESLYWACGFICGAQAVFLIHPLAGLGFLIVGAVVISVARRMRSA